MSILEVFRQRSKKNTSASVARERLQIIVAHERSNQNTPDYLPAMKKDILEVVRKYVDIGQDHVNITFESNQDVSILELNVTLPEQDRSETVPG